MERVVLALVIAVVAATVAVFLRARRPTPTLTASAGVPDRLDRTDFTDPDAAWLWVVFSSATCESCPVAVDAVAALATAGVVVEEVEYSARRDLHVKYGVDAVPLTLLADDAGRVRAHFVGRIDAGRVADAFERARSEETA